MTELGLKICIPLFMLVATWLIVFWQVFREKTELVEKDRDAKVLKEYGRLKRASAYFWLIHATFSAMTAVYSLFPDLYHVFMPLERFDIPYINLAGLVVMGAGIIWIVVAQVQIDKAIDRHHKESEHFSPLDLVRFSEQVLLSGMLILFVGFFTTITNIVGFFLVVIGLFVYSRLFEKSNLSTNF